MSEGVLFGLGALITLLVSIGLALPIYGAILDGRYQAQQEAAEVRQLADKRDGRRPAA
jgi:hypothetical protein